jgi:hypothetical protein
MSTSMADCGKKDPDARERTCLTCDIPVFCRNDYYRGKLLTERDFSDEQRYAIDKMRLHNLALHGWGVVCGLVVKPHPYCPELRLVVEQGFAIDDCGHEIRLLEEDWVELPQPTKKPEEGESPKQGASVTTNQKANGHQKSEGYTPDSHHTDKNQSSEDDEDVPLPYNPCDDTPMPKDLYLCIRYAECETEFSPAPFDDCSCTDSTQRPNRVCEGYKLERYESKPEWWDKVTHQECEYDDCRQYYHEAREQCPKINCFPCVPLAVIYNVVPGQPVKEDQIENWKPRRQLASTETLDKIVRCILDKIPTEKLTRIEDTNWEHGRRIRCHEFLEEFVGSHDHPRGFRIQFSQKVHSGAIDTRSFQALVVFRPENMADPKHMQIAPAHIDKEHDDETDWCRLRIDPAYVRRHLDGRDFDLFIILKCDVITDLHGRAVDGNFIGHRLPTGDNIQGGTFESWLRVRPRPRNSSATSGRERSL